MRSWPDTLPTFSLPDYGLTPVEQSRRTDMEVGSKRVRRITFARRDMVDVTVKLTDAQMAAFRAWVGDEAWSITGDSDDISSWSLTNATVTADAVIGPDDVLADRILETTTNAAHHVREFPGVLAIDNQIAVFHATMKAAGRSLVWVGMTDRAGAFGYVTADLAAGTLGATSGLAAAATITNRGAGWWRTSIQMNVAAGVSSASFRLQLLDAGGATSYVGDVTKGIDVCETQGRMATGYDLFVRTDAAHNALGAAGGSGWFFIPLALGGGVARYEARFDGPYTVKALPGFNWQLSGRLEVRNG